ncbi:hypothetical protein RUM44_013012 [Polyplax serrata]|uniref:Succinate dehydrogenase cytochrome b560 subunit, mitochondrial n=1 Tax=Polyplax serrata TaxID=468196 RepID=A0ABR1BHR0_POLSC
MALSARLLGRGLIKCTGLRSISASQCRHVTLQPKPAQLANENEGHDERNMRLCRPQSPHLTIYQIQLTSTLSITHRFTGIALSGYAAAFAATSLLSNKPMLDIINNISQCYPNFFMVFKFGLIFPFTYHFFNGIRHLMWDSGKNLSNKGVYASGYAMLAAAGISGAILYCY